MKKIICAIIAAMLSGLPLAALADAATQPEATQLAESVDIALENAPSLEDVAAANTAQAILKGHECYAIYALNYSYVDGETIERESMTAIINNGEGATLYSVNDDLSVVYDGENRYLIYANGTTGVNLCFDDEMKQYYDAQISENRLYELHEGETLVSCKQQGEEYILTTQMTHGQYADDTGRSYDLDDDALLINTITINAQTLEVSAWQLSADVAEGISVPLGAVSVVYDQVDLPEQYYQMADPINTRKVLVTHDPEGDNQSVDVFTIAEGAFPYVMAPDGFTATVLVNGQYIEADETNMSLTGDINIYLIPAEE